MGSNTQPTYPILKWQGILEYIQTHFAADATFTDLIRKLEPLSE